MFGLFRRKPKAETLNFDAIGVDMHSHVLPGIDDGAATVEDSVILIRELMDAGIKKVIATPHIMQDYYRNTPETVNAALGVLRAELNRQGIDIPVEAAAEYYFDEYFIKLVDSEADLLTMGNDKFLLMEFSFIDPPRSFVNTLQKLKSRGYRVILAHPERYAYYNLDELKNLKHWGFLLQLNTISLTGYYGREIKKMAEQLVDNNMVDLISSDMHHVRHAQAFKHSLNMPYVKRLLSGHQLKNSELL